MGKVQQILIASLLGAKHACAASQRSHPVRKQASVGKIGLDDAVKMSPDVVDAVPKQASSIVREAKTKAQVPKKASGIVREAKKSWQVAADGKTEHVRKEVSAHGKLQLDVSSAHDSLRQADQKCFKYTTSGTCPTPRCRWSTTSSECECNANVRTAAQCAALKDTCTQNNQDLASDADIYCCEDCGVRIVFGGGSHNTNNFGSLQRPEFVKSNRCNDTACVECGEEINCWYGFLKPNGNQGRMKVQVDSDVGYESFRMLAHATCDNGRTGNWGVQLGALTNGVVEVWLDEQLDSTLTGADIWNTRFFQYSPGTNQHFQLVFKPDMVNFPATADAKVFVDNVILTVEKCMTRENCKDVIGQTDLVESDNANCNQMECLKGSSTVNHQACEAWKACLDDDLEATLLAIMEASIPDCTTSSSLLQEDPLTCVDPRVEDFESWECECITQMQTACGSSSITSTCVKNLLCAEAGVCQSWKDEVQCSTVASLIQSEEQAHTRKNNKLLHLTSRAGEQEDTSESPALDEAVLRKNGCLR